MPICLNKMEIWKGPLISFVTCGSGAMLWIGIAGMGVAGMTTSIPGILTQEEPSLVGGTKGSKGFPEQTIFNLGLEPILPSSFEVFVSNRSLRFLLESLAGGLQVEEMNILDHHSWNVRVVFLSSKLHCLGSKTWDPVP